MLCIQSQQQTQVDLAFDLAVIGQAFRPLPYYADASTDYDIPEAVPVEGGSNAYSVPEAVPLVDVASLKAVIDRITCSLTAQCLPVGSLDLQRCDSYDSVSSCSSSCSGFSGSASCTSGSSDSEDSSHRGSKRIPPTKQITKKSRTPQTPAQRLALKQFKDSKKVEIDGEEYQGPYLPSNDEVSELVQRTGLTELQVCHSPQNATRLCVL